MHDYDNEASQSESQGSYIDEFSRSQTSVSKRAHVEHYDSEWQRKYDWLTPVKGSSSVVVGKSLPKALLVMGVASGA